MISDAEFFDSLVMGACRATKGRSLVGRQQRYVSAAAISNPMLFIMTIDTHNPGQLRVVPDMSDHFHLADLSDEERLSLLQRVDSFLKNKKIERLAILKTSRGPSYFRATRPSVVMEEVLLNRIDIERRLVPPLTVSAWFNQNQVKVPLPEGPKLYKRFDNTRQQAIRLAVFVAHQSWDCVPDRR
jgi:hypothetical protein